MSREIDPSKFTLRGLKHLPGNVGRGVQEISGNVDRGVQELSRNIVRSVQEIPGNVGRSVQEMPGNVGRGFIDAGKFLAECTGRHCGGKRKESTRRLGDDPAPLKRISTSQMKKISKSKATHKNK